MPVHWKKIAVAAGIILLVVVWRWQAEPALESAYASGEGATGYKTGRPGNEVPVEVEMREARLALDGLAKENLKFRKEILALREQVRRLTHSLANEKVRADRLMVARRADKQGDEGLPDPVLRQEIRLFDVDWPNRRGALNAGRMQGVRPDMIFGVVRDDRPLARARVREVRENVSAVEFEDAREGAEPRAGDRVIPWSADEKKR